MNKGRISATVGPHGVLHLSVVSIDQPGMFYIFACRYIQHFGNMCAVSTNNLSRICVFLVFPLRLCLFFKVFQVPP